jgi:hypothetical protein
MPRRIMTRILDVIETVVHFFDALAASPNPWNKLDTSSQIAGARAVQYRTRSRQAGRRDR